jgi:4'-phosphopantetheinyl transferase
MKETVPPLDLRIVEKGKVGPAFPPIERPAEDSIHLWEANLDLSKEEERFYKALLTRDEVARAQRYRSEIQRRRFTVCRGMLRRLLGAYLNTEGRAVPIAYAERGKPFLPLSDAHPPLEFNLSHSEDRALIGVASEFSVGVDIERIRTDIELSALVKHCLSPGEIEPFNALPQEDRMIAFYRAWTQKEAYLKATGDGLWTSMRDAPAGLSSDGVTSFAVLEGAYWAALLPLAEKDGFCAALCALKRSINV